MLNRRKKRSLDRSVPHHRDTNIIYIGIEGGDRQSSREARYFDIFKERDIRFQFKVIPCDENRSSPDQVLGHLKSELEKELLQDGDEKWMVVDVDEYEPHLSKVGQECKDAGINLAVSNPCFEFWLLLHYENPKGSLPSCNEVKAVLNPHMNEDPNNDSGYASMFFDKAETAIERASQRDNPEERWPNQNGSRIYQIIQRFFDKQ